VAAVGRPEERRNIIIPFSLRENHLIPTMVLKEDLNNSDGQREEEEEPQLPPCFPLLEFVLSFLDRSFVREPVLLQVLAPTTSFRPAAAS